MPQVLWFKAGLPSGGETALLPMLWLWEVCCYYTTIDSRLCQVIPPAWLPTRAAALRRRVAGWHVRDRFVKPAAIHLIAAAMVWAGALQRSAALQAAWALAAAVLKVVFSATGSEAPRRPQQVSRAGAASHAVARQHDLDTLSQVPTTACSMRVRLPLSVLYAGGDVSLLSRVPVALRSRRACDPAGSTLN